MSKEDFEKEIARMKKENPTSYLGFRRKRLLGITPEEQILVEDLNKDLLSRGEVCSIWFLIAVVRGLGSFIPWHVKTFEKSSSFYKKVEKERERQKERQKK